MPMGNKSYIIALYTGYIWKFTCSHKGNKLFQKWIKLILYLQVLCVCVCRIVFLFCPPSCSSMCPPTNIGNLVMNVCVYAYVHQRCVVIQGRAQGGGDFDLVAPPGWGYGENKSYVKLPHHISFYNLLKKIRLPLSSIFLMALPLRKKLIFLRIPKEVKEV